MLGSGAFVCLVELPGTDDTIHHHLEALQIAFNCTWCRIWGGAEVTIDPQRPMLVALCMAMVIMMIMVLLATAIDGHY